MIVVVWVLLIVAVLTGSTSAQSKDTRAAREAGRKAYEARSRGARSRWVVPLDLEARCCGRDARAIADANSGSNSRGAPQPPRVSDAADRRPNSHSDVHWQRRNRSGHELRGHCPPEGWRVAHVSRPPERQPSQPAERGRRAMWVSWCPSGHFLRRAGPGARSKSRPLSSMG
jgi:hypothetical protein